MYAADVIEPAECSVSSSSPLYLGSPAACSGVIVLNSQSAGPEITFVCPSVFTDCCTMSTDDSFGAPP